MITVAKREALLVLPDRIELSTSPLPRECSTTELRQQASNQESAQQGSERRAILATRAPVAQAATAALSSKTARSGSAWAAGLEFGHFVAIMIEWVMADFLRPASDYSLQRRLSGVERAMRR